MPNIDPEVQAILNLEIPEDLMPEDSGDAFSKFIEASKLAGELGRSGWRFIAALDEETQVGRARFDATVSKARTVPRSVSKEDVSDTSLAKMASPRERRKANIRAWLNGELALGKTVNDLATHAAQHDVETASVIREIGAEMRIAENL